VKANQILLIVNVIMTCIRLPVDFPH
jgi:hypothetical protein